MISSLAIATPFKKNVRHLAFGCYSGQTMFSKLNKHHEHNTRTDV
ncbi:L-aspartate oxidase [Enterobacter sp. 63]